MRKLPTQNSEKVNFWEGIIGNHVIGSFFIDGNWNGLNYLALLQNNIVPTIYPAQENPQVPANVIRFQQDGAPPTTLPNRCLTIPRLNILKSVAKVARFTRMASTFS